MDVQVNERLYPCTKCKRKFVTSEFLQAHERTHARAYKHTHTWAHEHTMAYKHILSGAHNHTHIRAHEPSHIITNELSHTRTNEHTHTRVHEHMHNRARPYECNVCQKTFKQLMDMLVHQSTHEDEESPQDNDSKIFKNLSENVYITKQSSIQSPSSKVSLASVKSASKQRELRIIEMGERSYACLKCNKQFKNRLDRCEHECTNISIEGQLDSYPSEVLKHLENTRVKTIKYVSDSVDKKNKQGIDPSQDTNQVPQCNSSRRSNNAQLTKRSRRSDKCFSCTTCSKQYTRMDHLRRHLLSRSSCLRTHSLVHPEEKKHICKICSKSFVSISKLLRHEIIHTKETPFKCEQCEKQFKHQHSLMSHERVHSGECLSVYATCKKQLINTSDLNNHRKGHKKERRILERPYSHLASGKISSDAASLSAHRCVHTKKRSHKCNVCAKSFCKPSQLRRHELVHYRKVPYKCSKCELRFSDKASLLLHERCHREEEDEILCASFMSLSTKVDWRWCKGVRTQRLLSALISTPISICTNCSALFGKRVSLDNHCRVSCIVTYGCDTCGDVSDSITSLNNGFNSHHESIASSSVVSDVLSDIKYDESLIIDAKQIEDTETNHNALTIGDVTLSEVKEEKDIFTMCTNNNIIIVDHAYALKEELLCKAQLL